MKITIEVCHETVREAEGLALDCEYTSLDEVLRSLLLDMSSASKRRHCNEAGPVCAWLQDSVLKRMMEEQEEAEGGWR